MNETGIRATRKRQDWIMVMAALRVIDETRIADAVKAMIRQRPDSDSVTLEQWGEDGDMLAMAIELADRGRPAHWPAVTIERLTREVQ